MTVREFAPTRRRARDERGRRKPRIIYVEDEDINWEIAERSLRDHYEMRRAANARSFFDLLLKWPPDAILMDIQLANSDLNGIEITEALNRKNGRQLPSYARDVDLEKVPSVIFVTAYSSRYSEEMLVRSGGVGRVAKPVDFTSLSLAISRVIVKALTDKG